MKKYERNKNKKQKLAVQAELAFGENIEQVSHEDQPFSAEHGWEETRLAGIFAYLVTLITQNQWVRLIMGYFGNNYKIFMVFVLMGARNIRSIEQLKNIHRREAWIILGIKTLPPRFRARHWLHDVSKKKIFTQLNTQFFRSQFLTSLVGVWLWFTDGHHLPYTGKKRLHAGAYSGLTHEILKPAIARVLKKN